jgi:hypothetical protein
MPETRTVQLNICLPPHIASLAEEVQDTDPDFLSRIVLYGLTRKTIYEHLSARGRSAGGSGAGSSAVV